MNPAWSLLTACLLHVSLASISEHIKKPDRAHLVSRRDPVIVGLVLKRQGHDALLLQVGLVDARKGLRQDDSRAEVPGLEGGVLAGRALAVVVLRDDEPLLSAVLPQLAELGDGVLGAVEVVGGVDLARFGVDGGVERVGADVGEVALVLEPGPRGGDGVGGAFAGDLDEDAEAGEVGVGERGKGLEEGEAVGGRRDGDRNAGVGLLGEHAEGGDAGLEGGPGPFEAARGGELEVLAGGGLDGVGQGVEGGGAGKRHGGDDLGRGEEVHGFGVAVVPAAEVAVVGGQDGVGRPLGDAVLPLPLADAGAAGVGQQDAPGGLKRRQRAVALQGGADLLAAGGDVEVGGGLEARGGRLLEEALHAGHVLVGAVGAAADEAGRQLLGPPLVPDGVLELGQGGGQVGGEGPVDVGLQLGEVDGDELVVLGALVGLEAEAGVRRRAASGEALQGPDVLNGPAAARGFEVPRRGLGVGEDGRGRAHLGAHVADGGHAGGAQRVDARAEVLDDGAGAAADGQLARQLQDDVLGRDPVAQPAGEPHAEDLWGPELPRRADQGLHGIGAADADRHGAEAAGVGAVAVRPQHHQARQRVVLQHGLVDDARAGRPKVHAVPARRRLQEVEDLLVRPDARGQVVVGAPGPDNQVVAVDAGRDRRPLEAARHELQQRHLRRRVLHVDPVGLQQQVRLAADAAPVVRVAEQRLLHVVQVAVQDLLGQRQALPAEHAPHVGVSGEQLLVGRRQ
ncbi:hypothetical protein Trco_002984 [Trichoderma cornu-damae]|uniref:Uncharacterized protein n=1 Tax=Trichoderma cornu-damae TaxID=654480 RepID=A0A9P8TYI7_9HYPO|nr:hypothetical protein Trco_002984 [Trichoderma cornu-damae]